MLEIRWREGRRPVGVNNTSLLDLRAPSMPCRLVQVTLWVTAPEAKHPLNSAWFDLPITSQTFTGKDFSSLSRTFNGEQNQDISTAPPSLLWITLLVTRFSHTQFFCQRLSWMRGGGGGCYIPRVELMLRSICARKTEVSTGMPPRFRISYFATRGILTTPEDDTHVNTGEAVPIRFSPTVTFMVMFSIWRCCYSVVYSFPVVICQLAQAMLTGRANRPC